MAISSPLDLPTCVLWLDSDDELSGGNWLDKSGAGNHATPGISPVLDPTGINGRPAMLFSRSAHSHLDLPGYLFDTGGGTTLVAAKIRTFLTTGTRAAFLISAQHGVSNDYHRWYILAAPDALSFSIGENTARDTTRYSISQSATEATPYVVAARSNGSTARFDTKCPPLSSTLTLPSLSGRAPRCVIGRINTDSDSEEWDGWIGEIVHYDRALSDGELVDAVAYLSAKWGVACEGAAGWKIGRL